jgi:acyl-coenzyme A thioesterase PaaI-like protein
MVTMKATTVKRFLNWYPPFIGASIRVKELSPDFRHALTEMRLTWYNRNYVNSHFGGSLYTMCDPMYMLMLLNILGNDYIVWDKAASIEYVKPGRTTVTAEFRISDDLIKSLRAMEPDERKVFDLHVDVKDTDGEVVARVTKTEFVNRKKLKSKL